MKQIPLSQGKFALVDDEDYDYLIQWKWYFAKKSKKESGYARRKKYIGEVNGQKKWKAIWMHKEILHVGLNQKVDHIDEDKLNNQKYNLRSCTNAENSRNRGKNSANKSGYKGVCWYGKTNRWLVQIGVDFKIIRLGYFKDKDEAARAYNAAAVKYHGEFAKLNEIPR
jgi:hypothetical protein